MDHNRQGPSPTELYVWNELDGKAELPTPEIGLGWEHSLVPAAERHESCTTRTPMGTGSPCSPSIRSHTRFSPPSSFCAQGLLHRDTGKCVWVTWQTPMHPSKPTYRPVQVPPPALTSIRDDLIFSWLGSPQPPASCPGEGSNDHVLCGDGCEPRMRQACFSAGTGGSQQHRSSRLCYAASLTPAAPGWAGRHASRCQLLQEVG